MKVEALGQAVLMALDTGADTTDLNENFAAQFKSVIGGAKKTTQDITGVGGTRTFDALELPEVAFTIGPKRVFLRPATISRGIEGIEAFWDINSTVESVAEDLLQQAKDRAGE